MKKISILFGWFLLLLSGCVNLDEEIYDKHRAEGFIKSPEDALAVLAPAYGSLRARGVVFDFMWEAVELTSGTMVTPTRGQHWYEGGRFQRAHLQKFDYQDGISSGPWGSCFSGISTCNRILFQLKNQEFEDKDMFLGEVRMIRAYYLFQLMSLYGNIPYVDRFDVEEGFLPEQYTQDEVYDILIKELNEVIPLLSKEVDGSTYSRWTYWAGLALRARVYLNAHMFKSKSTDPASWGTNEFDKCMADCDKIINSGKFSIEPDFKANFKADNHVSKEIIYAIPFDNIHGSGWYIANKTLHYQNQHTFGLSTKPWNGMCAIPEFYNSFDDEDYRKTDCWLVGQQYSRDGKPLVCTEESKGQPLVFVPDGFTYKEAKEYHGARVNKWEFYEDQTMWSKNDFPVFRLADAYMMKAECLWRKGNVGEAADIINTQIRARNFKTPKPVSAAELTEERLLDEMRWEFFGELRVRLDMRRFGKLTKGKWLNKPAYDHYDFDWLPIPKAALDSNSKLKQNPGAFYSGMN